MKHRAVGLLSGGLDSRLALKLVIDEGVEVHALNFVTPFCTCTAQGCRSEARAAAKDLGVPLKVMNNSEPLLKAVRSPKFGYGRGANPCLDCRAISLSRAADYMREIGATFLVTGEVLGQRPMSQRREAIRTIEREAGVEGLVLRPLSARHFPPTWAEQAGLVSRDRMLALSGRSRRPQIELAEELGVRDYPCPAGGCLLTDQTFGRRLKKMLTRFPDPAMPQVTLLKAGRHLLTDAGDWLIIPREELENRRLENLRHALALIGSAARFAGPTAGFLSEEWPSPASLQDAADLVARYGSGRGKCAVEVRFERPDGSSAISLTGRPQKGYELAERLTRL